MVLITSAETSAPPSRPHSSSTNGIRCGRRPRPRAGPLRLSLRPPAGQLRRLRRLRLRRGPGCGRARHAPGARDAPARRPRDAPGAPARPRLRRQRRWWPARPAALGGRRCGAAAAALGAGQPPAAPLRRDRPGCGPARVRGPARLRRSSCRGLRARPRHGADAAAGAVFPPLAPCHRPAPVARVPLVAHARSPDPVCHSTRRHASCCYLVPGVTRPPEALDRAQPGGGRSRVGGELLRRPGAPRPWSAGGTWGCPPAASAARSGTPGGVLSAVRAVSSRLTSRSSSEW